MARHEQDKQESVAARQGTGPEATTEEHTSSVVIRVSGQKAELIIPKEISEAIGDRTIEIRGHERKSQGARPDRAAKRSGRASRAAGLRLTAPGSDRRVGIDEGGHGKNGGPRS